MPETTPNSHNPEISPEDVLLSSFFYLHKESLTLEELLKYAETMHSPSPDVTQAILAKLVEQGFLVWQKVDDIVYFRRAPTSTQRIYVN